MNDAIRPEAIVPLSADEEVRLRAEAESEKDHENKRHARWQQLVLRLLATLDRDRETSAIFGFAARVPVSPEGLDVERLARALRAFWPVIFREDDVVADVAAEYAALAERGKE